MGIKRKRQEKEECNYENCVGCKQRCVNGSRVFCGYLRKFIDKPRDGGIEITVCPGFEVEPFEYKVYRRT